MDQLAGPAPFHLSSLPPKFGIFIGADEMAIATGPRCMSVVVNKELRTRGVFGLRGRGHATRDASATGLKAWSAVAHWLAM